MTTFPIETLTWMAYEITDDICSSLIRRFAFSFSQHNLEIISYLYRRLVSISSNFQMNRPKNQKSNPKAKIESMTLSSRRPVVRHLFFFIAPQPSHWLGVDPMKFAILFMMQYDINMKSSEDCAKIKSDWVSNNHFKSFKWNNHEMLQKWSHHSQESEVINSLAFICISMKFMVRNAEKL